MTEFNLDSLPKRMPYRMPEGTLEQIERNVMLRIGESKGDGRRPDVAASPTAATPRRDSTPTSAGATSGRWAEPGY